ncbi:hypothetical protein BZA70DRAFT_287731 [Myxozyma melibiosi]|uniref:Uncharacterized protein n=1 Tax=Myxozyma melibiosi TaxID=54550 RepID=A0ABR1FF18_9ASCO
MVKIDPERFAQKPRFSTNPIDNLRFHARVSPQYFYPLAMTLVAVPVLFAFLPIRRKYFYPDHKRIPTQYPLPSESVEVAGFEDA